jgi:transcriptional regulator with AAA-type ATPase domain
MRIVGIVPLPWPDGRILIPCAGDHATNESMVRAGNTTAREESYQAQPPAQLGLRWVWPRPRLERPQGTRLTIGRDEAASIKLDGPGVSRHHAELYRQGPLYVIRDLGSTNGTWLGGRPIEHAPIAPGNVLRIGGWVGVFCLTGPEDIEFGELAPGVFGSREIESVLGPIRRAAVSDVPVLLVGATGTGKERIAHAVHHFSRRSGPFIAVNCAALPEQLAEAELFGYRRGAFTGADRANTGFFRAAHGGTLFLDEMPELPASLQAKLLRVVEDGQVQSLGEPAAVGVNVGIISASQKPLTELVQAGKLRQDLAARLSGLDITLPPLAARRADIAPLFAQFLEQQAGGRPPEVEARLIEALCLHDWPQNVRELVLLTRTLLAVHGHEPKLTRNHLPAPLAALCQDRPNVARPSRQLRERREHDLEGIRRELAASGGNVKAVAEALGLSRQRIYRLLDGEAGSDRSGESTNGVGD